MTEYSVPIPTTTRDTNDLFTGIFLGAPDFERLNSIGCSYTITLDMMMNALCQGITNVASRTKKPEARALFQHCLEEVNAIHLLYRENKLDEAGQRIQLAKQLFAQAGKAKSQKAES